MDLAIDWALRAFFLVGLAYLTFKTIQVADRAGFDFRYMWVAGKLWAQGINPYLPEYHSLASRLVTDGHVPISWAYPPNWFIPSLLLAQAELAQSAFIYNIFNVLVLVASSALLTASLHKAPSRLAAGTLLDRARARLSEPRNVFLLHLGLMAILQATALVLSTGQTSILVYFGLSLLLYGLAKERQAAAVLGLTLMLLKPQLGAFFVAVLLMNRAHWGLVLKAMTVSALISLPAFIAAPSAAFDWLTNLGQYDDLSTANAPAAMTGVRNLAWDLLHLDIGNVAGLAIAIAVAVALCAFAKLRAGRTDTLAALVLAAAVATAFAPLHLYDLVIVGVTLFAVAGGGLTDKLLGGLGGLLMWRADDLAMVTGFYSPEAQHFEGSRSATLGSFLILIAVYRAVTRMRQSRGEPVLSAGRRRPREAT